MPSMCPKCPEELREKTDANRLQPVLRKFGFCHFFEKRQVTCMSIIATIFSRSRIGSQRRKAKESGRGRMARQPDGNFPSPWFRCILISDGVLNISISKHSNIVIKLRMPVSLAASVRDPTNCRTLLSVTMRDSRFIVVIQTRIL